MRGLRWGITLAMMVGLALPAAANAAVDVTRDAATGGLLATSTGDTADTLSMVRADDGVLRISGGATSSDGSCTAGIDMPAELDCVVAAGTKVAISLGGGADRLDATAALGVTLTVDGGAGTDTLILGSSGMTTVIDASAQDTVDLSSADASIRVRYSGTPRRLVARCTGCAVPWAVTLPLAPGRVVLGPQADDVDLAAWRTFGRSTWLLGAGDDRFWGAPYHRSIVFAGDGNDALVSRTAADVLRGDRGRDRIADFGGTGDILLGGADTDVLSSLDGRRDTLDGGAALDRCMSTSREASGCDTRPGGVRNAEDAGYLPVHGMAIVLTALGIAH